MVNANVCSPAGAVEALLEDLRGQRQAAEAQLQVARCAQGHPLTKVGLVVTITWVFKTA